MRFSSRKIGFLLLKIAVVVLSYLYIWNRFKHRPAEELWPGDHASVGLLIAAVLLMPLNWLTEAKKWQFLTQKTERLQLQKAMVSVLTGITLGIFTPNRIGEPAGRILLLRKRNRLKGLWAALAGSFSQTINTLIFGLLGVFTVWNYAQDGNSLFGNAGLWLIGTAIMITVISLILYFRMDKVVHFFENRRLSDKIKASFQILKRYSRKELLVTVGYSSLRYMIFILQLFLLLHFFRADIPFYFVFPAAAASFLVNFIVPGIALADIGIRSSSALFFFGFFSDNDSGILAAGFVLWLINLVVPALAGSLLLLMRRFWK